MDARGRKDGGSDWNSIPVGKRDEITSKLERYSLSGANTGIAAAYLLPTAVGIHQGNHTRISMKRTNSGYLTLKAKISGRDVNLIVDTGAPGTHLDRTRTNNLHLAWHEIVNDPLAQLKREKRRPVFAILDRLEIGTLRWEQLPVREAILDDVNHTLSLNSDPPVDGVLGADIFESASAIIDYRTCELILSDLPNKRRELNVFGPAEKQAHNVSLKGVFPASVAGTRPGPFHFQTGEYKTFRDSCGWHM